MKQFLIHSHLWSLSPCCTTAGKWSCKCRHVAKALSTRWHWMQLVGNIVNAKDHNKIHPLKLRGPRLFARSMILLAFPGISRVISAMKRQRKYDSNNTRATVTHGFRLPAPGTRMCSFPWQFRRIYRALSVSTCRRGHPRPGGQPADSAAPLTPTPVSQLVQLFRWALREGTKRLTDESFIRLETCLAR